MKYRTLGKTGLTISEIGFGAWGIGGPTEGLPSYGPTDDAESKKALETAFEKGITFYDTSDLYGRGHSEKLIGEVFHARRDKVIIATKVGFTKPDAPHDLTPDHMRASLEASLQRLDTDYVDLYQLHSPPIEMITKDVVDTLEAFKKEGKIRAFGLSVKNPEDGMVAAKTFGFTALQANFNMIDQRIIANGLLTFAEENNVGIIARTPFNFGFLTGAAKNLTFDPTDHRSKWPKEQLERWANAPDLFTFINQGKKRTPAQLALQFCLSFPAISAVIPGIMHPNEAEENAMASDLESLTQEEIAMIEKVGSENVFFERPNKK
jgi:aryl-alcohol dehydrogenase-like predicted oxidoreductase